MFWGTRATNFAIYTTKMEGAGPKILGTGAKVKQVPCQKNCRVNRAKVTGCLYFNPSNSASNLSTLIAVAVADENQQKV